MFCLGRVHARMVSKINFFLAKFQQTTLYLSLYSNNFLHFLAYTSYRSRIAFIYPLIAALYFRSISSVLRAYSACIWLRACSYSTLASSGVSVLVPGILRSIATFSFVVASRSCFPLLGSALKWVAFNHSAPHASLNAFSYLLW